MIMQRNSGCKLPIKRGLSGNLLLLPRSSRQNVMLPSQWQSPLWSSEALHILPMQIKWESEAPSKVPSLCFPCCLRPHRHTRGNFLSSYPGVSVAGFPGLIFYIPTFLRALGFVLMPFFYKLLALSIFLHCLNEEMMTFINLIKRTTRRYPF